MEGLLPGRPTWIEKDGIKKITVGDICIDIFWDWGISDCQVK